MNDKSKNNAPSAAHNSHHAEKRRKRRDVAKDKRSGTKGNFKAGGRDKPARETIQGSGSAHSDRVLLYGLHTVRAALQNPERKHFSLKGTRNALNRLEIPEAELPVTFEEVHARELDKWVGSDAVHQGVVLECAPLAQQDLAAISQKPLLLVLDQVTDPHNVGAIMRSAVAMNAGAIITTARHSPAESGVLAKSASGALDMVPYVQITNLAAALEELHGLGYFTVGLDSEGPKPIESSFSGDRIALVLGSEGKGLRQKTRDTCSTLARLDMPGPIKSLNVSNACALSLYAASLYLVAK